MTNRDRSASPRPAPSASPAPRRGLLIWLSGADTDTLQHSPRERRKYSGLGGVVLTTSSMATLSAGFALYIGMRAPIWAAIVVALLWGLAIANLDRWLVAAAARREKWWQNLATLLPRVLLALVIGAVVSTPLVLWIFQREIEAQLTVIQQDKRNAFEQSLTHDARFVPIPGLEADVARLEPIAAGTVTEDTVSKDPAVVQYQKEYDEADKKFQDAQASAICEFDGTCGTHTRGDGEAYQAKLKIANDLKAQRDAAKTKLDKAKSDALAKQHDSSGTAQSNAKTELATKQAELTRLKNLKQAEQDKYLADSKNDRGLLARLEALSDIADKNATLKTAYLTLMLFITAIEILPVLTKFLLNLGPAGAYDTILADSEKADIERARAANEFEREQRERSLQARLAQEQEAATKLAEREATIAAEIRERELDQWRVAELRRVNGQPPLPAADNTKTRRLRLPGQGRKPADTSGYAAWPEDEASTARTTPAAAPDHLTEDDGATTRWRFKQP